MLLQSFLQPQVKCRYCNKTEYTKKHGKSRAGLSRYFCKSCNKTFQIRYIYKGNENKMIQAAGIVPALKLS